MEMYVQGVSTWKAKKITEKLCGLDISKSQVAELDEHVDAWRSRPIEEEYPYLIIQPADRGRVSVSDHRRAFLRRSATARMWRRTRRWS